MTWLLTFLITVSLYDLRTQLIPNWCTIPLIMTGFVIRFPGNAELSLATFFLFTAWLNHVMGAGDAKLWIGLLWALPVEFTSETFLSLCVVFIGTSLLQITWRLIRKQRTVEILAPAAWRTIPFILLVWYVQ
jgi:Flp pilus assembly protein protease CpaA